MGKRAQRGAELPSLSHGGWWGKRRGRQSCHPPVCPRHTALHRPPLTRSSRAPGGGGRGWQSRWEAAAPAAPCPLLKGASCRPGGPSGRRRSHPQQLPGPAGTGKGPEWKGRGRGWRRPRWEGQPRTALLPLAEGSGGPGSFPSDSPPEFYSGTSGGRSGFGAGLPSRGQRAGAVAGNKARRGGKGHPLLPSPGDPAALPAAFRRATSLTRSPRHARHGGQRRERSRACPALSGAPPGLPEFRPRREHHRPGEESAHRSPRHWRPGRAAAPLTSWRPLGRSPRRSWRPAAPGCACPGPRRCCPSRDPRRRRTAAPRWRRRRRRRAGKRRPAFPASSSAPAPAPTHCGEGPAGPRNRNGAGRGGAAYLGKPSPR